MKLYMVRQTQPFENYEDTTIAIYDNIEQANELARKLKQKGLKLDIENIHSVDDFIKQYMESKHD